MLKVLFPAAALITVLAFGARTETADLTAAGEAAPMAWSLTREADMAKLAYGVPNSDQLAVMLTCAPGEAVSVYGPARPDSPAVRQAASRVAPIDPLSGDLMEDIRLPLGDRSLKQLAAGTGLPIRNDMDEPRLIPAGPEGGRLAQAFIAHCASART